VAETYEIPAGGPDRPGQPALEEVINAEFALERWHERGRLAQRIVVITSVAMAYLLLVRGGAASLGGKLVLSFWLTAMILFIISLVMGKRALDRVDRLVAARGGRRIRHDDPPNPG